LGSTCETEKGTTIRRQVQRGSETKDPRERSLSSRPPFCLASFRRPASLLRTTYLAMAEVTPPPSAAVASLKSIFPSLEDGVIASVLAQHDGNEDRAVESLLALTDDTFVSPERPGEDTVGLDITTSSSRCALIHKGRKSVELTSIEPISLLADVVSSSSELKPNSTLATPKHSHSKKRTPLSPISNPTANSNSSNERAATSLRLPLPPLLSTRTISLTNPECERPNLRPTSTTLRSRTTTTRMTITTEATRGGGTSSLSQGWRRRSRSWPSKARS
jgi:hypothetical protein